MILDLYDISIRLAKVTITQPLTQPQAFVLSGTQIFVALVAGVLMAFAFQFLLTNLTLATEISTENSPLETSAADDWSNKVQNGVWALITVNLALFGACYLAVKLTLVNSISLEAITGLLIWSAFFLMLLWISSRTVSSSVGSVVNSALSGLQGIVPIVTTALGGKAVNAQVVNTVRESVAYVRREISLAVDPTGVRGNLEDYLKLIHYYFTRSQSGFRTVARSLTQLETCY
ncbi:hypothetical protein [Myxosarcina sp. GI1(2024)]